ncbi:MAG: GNAT family N-acetyltransferase [Bacteroidales bacterium]|nr:GNAT family N-acetyltransferase [Bacteroidales bacterium]
MKLLTDGEIPLPQWEAFVRENSRSSPFQTPAYFDFFNSVRGMAARAFAVVDDAGIRSLAVVTYQKEKGLKGYFSRRAIVYGGILYDDETPHAADMLLKAVVSDADRKSIYTEVRNLSDYRDLRELFKENGFEYIPYLNFRIDTGNREEMFRRISTSRQRQIKKAGRMSVTCGEAAGTEEVLQFYVMLRRLYREKLHKPLPAEDFFMEFYRRNLGKYLLVRHDTKIIGGIMCPVLDGRALYEFYISGMDESLPDHYPSVMATWCAMEYACNNGIGLFDMMGAGRAGEHYGVRDFKARFGGAMVEYGRFLRVSRPALYRLGKTGLLIMKNAGL